MARITFVGSAAEALKKAPAGATKIDLTGKTVLPGLTDAHAHLAGIGFREIEFDLQDVPSLSDLKRRLKARGTPRQSPVIGLRAGAGSNRVGAPLSSPLAPISIP